MRDVLRGVDARNGVGLARELRVELGPRGEQLATPVVEAGRNRGLRRAKLFAIRVLSEHRELCLCGAQRQLLVAPRDARGEQVVLQRVFPSGQLRIDKTFLTGQSQTFEAFACVTVRSGRSIAELLEL